MKLNLGCGKYVLEGFDNLDKLNGWTFESGLPYQDESVEAITISHALMYVGDENWAFVFNELYRVLKRGGIVRVTEDATDDKRSERFGGIEEAKALTSFMKVADAFDVRFRVFRMDENTTYFRDLSLLQNWHGGTPKVFFIEAIKI
jgi:SAM-dependent methyltransferase